MQASCLEAASNGRHSSCRDGTDRTFGFYLISSSTVSCKHHSQLVLLKRLIMASNPLAIRFALDVTSVGPPLPRPACRDRRPFSCSISSLIKLTCNLSTLHATHAEQQHSALETPRCLLRTGSALDIAPASQGIAIDNSLHVHTLRQRAA